jgi:hypothetical protein
MNEDKPFEQCENCKRLAQDISDLTFKNMFGKPSYKRWCKDCREYHNLVNTKRVDMERKKELDKFERTMR